MKCSHFRFSPDENHKYYVNSSNHSNCLFCLIADHGPMTQEEIANFLGCSKMRISQIEELALKKLKKRLPPKIKKEYES